MKVYLLESNGYQGFEGISFPLHVEAYLDPEKPNLVLVKTEELEKLGVDTSLAIFDHLAFEKRYVQGDYSDLYFTFLDLKEYPIFGECGALVYSPEEGWELGYYFQSWMSIDSPYFDVGNFSRYSEELFYKTFQKWMPLPDKMG